MAMSAGPNNINMTPLIDVLLVLLVIFLVAMPVMLKMERVDVPPKDDSVTSAEPAAQLKVKVDGSYDLDDIPIMATELATRLRAKLDKASEPVVFVDFEDGVPWREVVAAVDLVKGVGSDRTAVAVRMHP